MISGHEVSYAEVAAIKLDLSKGLLVCMYADHRQVFQIILLLTLNSCSKMLFSSYNPEMGGTLVTT